MKLFDVANEYCRQSDWKTIATLKFCLLSLGILIGVLLPKACKAITLAICGVVFVVTYIPLMLKLFGIIQEK